MVSEFFSDITSTVLSKTLDAASSRQRTIANNIANVETPGYKRSSISFEIELQKVLSKKRNHDVREGLRKLTPMQQIDFLSPGRPDGNNVSIDKEVSDLARNQLIHKAATVLLEAKISMLRSAIMEGKR